MRKSILLVFLLVLATVSGSFSQDTNDSILFNSEGEMYLNGWDFIGIQENTHIPAGTFLYTPFYSKIIAKRDDVLVLELIGREILYFDKLNPEEVDRIPLNTLFEPKQEIVKFPIEFDRRE
jgi:hypothetical protein